MGGVSCESGGPLVAGTTSGAGKSAVTGGICRWRARRDVEIVPFGAQSMPQNPFVAREGVGTVRDGRPAWSRSHA